MISMINMNLRIPNPLMDCIKRDVEGGFFDSCGLAIAQILKEISLASLPKDVTEQYEKAPRTRVRVVFHPSQYIRLDRIVGPLKPYCRFSHLAVAALHAYYHCKSG